MLSIPKIPIDDYNYLLPDDRIAQKAAEPRDSSKLLLYNKGNISVNIFKNLPDCLAEGDHLVFNNTKVIPARIFTQNQNGARVEIFLLNPVGQDHSMALATTNTCRWECLIGNSKKWKSEEILSITIEDLRLELKREDNQIVKFEWEGGLHFSEILNRIGRLPLPPYIKHEADEEDSKRYQTVFSKIEGSVAAPTAGLHFTDEVLQNLADRGIRKSFLTLHVGAGTFLPVKVEDATQHAMHSESFEVSRQFLESIKTAGRLLVVGTTACRVMESLHNMALSVLDHTEPGFINQFAYVGENRKLSKYEVAETLLGYMNANGLEILKGRTSIMIIPGYEFKLIDGLITNFHQPKSTLLLLIAALIGDDWKKVYKSAMDNGFRFLSYGDSSLLIP